MGAVYTDPLILEIMAHTDKLERSIRSARAQFTTESDKMQRSSDALRRSIETNSDAAGAAFKRIAAAVGAAFSAQQVAGLIDGYTRFTNQLKVAGLEGENLARVQETLFGIAQRYGVELESVGTLYGRTAAAAKELGLSQKEQATITEATAAALKVSGASAGEASGALLQLSQALGGSNIQAEEYNSLIDGLRPLLNAVANGSEKWGGSVAVLTAEVKKGNVSTREFVQALLKGAPVVMKQAESATLTLSGAFTKLTNALERYVGSAAEANGATAAIGHGLELLANNLDTVADAVAVIGTVMLGRFVAGMTAAAASTGAASAAAFAFQARLAGAATSMEALAFAGGAARAGLLAAFGGPVGVAVAALAAGILILNTRTEENTREGKIAAQVQEKLGDSSQKAADAIDRLANAHGKAREEARKETEQLKKLTEQRLKDAQAALLQAQAEYARTKAEAGTSRSPGASAASGAPGYAAGLVRQTTDQGAVNQALDRVVAGEKTVGALMQQLEGYKAALVAPEKKLRGIDDGKKAKVRKDTFSDVGQFDREISSLQQEELRSREQLATDARLQANFRHAQVAADVEAYRKSLEDRLNSENLSKTQRARIVEQNKSLLAQREENAQLEHALINRELDDRLTSEEVDLHRSRIDAQREALDAALDMARTEKDRRAVQLQILDAEMEARRVALQQVLDSRSSTDAQRQVATEELGRLPGQRASRARSIERQTQGPLEAYLDKMPKTAAEIDERIQGYVVDELESVRKGINDAISSKLGVKDPLLAGLLDIFIEDVFIQPLAQALASARQKGGGSGLAGIFGSIFGGGKSSGLVAGDDTLGGILNPRDPFASMGKSFFSSLFGRASGGYVAPGQTVRVNEHRGGVELLRMGSQGGSIIPLGRTDAARPVASRGGNVYNITVSADHSVTPAGFARDLSKQILARAQQMDAQAARATLRAVPQRMQGYQNDGT